MGEVIPLAPAKTPAELESDGLDPEARRAEFLRQLAEHIAAAEAIGDLVTLLATGRQNITAVLPELAGTPGVTPDAANAEKWQTFVAFLHSLEMYYTTDLTSEGVYEEWRKHFVRRGVSAPEVISRLMAARRHDMQRRPAYHYALFQHLLRLLESRGNED